jgi:hypothetical protein
VLAILAAGDGDGIGVQVALSVRCRFESHATVVVERVSDVPKGGWLLITTETIWVNRPSLGAVL